MSKPTKFAHVVYRTRRFDDMLDWYCTVFEASVQYRNDALAFLTYDDEHHRIAIVNLDVLAPDAPGPQHPAKATVEHVAYTYASLEDLMGNYERLKARGIEPYWAIHHGMTISFYYADPDGNQMEFQVDCFPSPEQANAYMHSDDYAANPIGVELDPEAIAAHLLEGRPVADLMPRPHGPMSPIRSALNPR
ncbi:MAG: VOC family protein [Gammaproteobacteria bacterium]